MKNKQNDILTFGQHLKELRRRLIWVLGFFLAGIGVGIIYNPQLIKLIQAPLGQTLYFTSPMGGLGFSLQVCLLVGMIVAIPAGIYHLLKFIDPTSRIVLPKYTYLILFASVTLALMGLAFAYLISLPSALHFLIKFGGSSLQAIITTDQYFSFVLSYLGGSILIFQLPLIMLIINRLTPLTPHQLKKYQPHVLVTVFVAAAILTPTPDPLNQTILALPMIVLFELSCLLILIVNYQPRSKPSMSATNVTQSRQKPAVATNYASTLVAEKSPAMGPTMRSAQTGPAVLDLSHAQPPAQRVPARRVMPMVDIRPTKV